MPGSTATCEQPGSRVIAALMRALDRRSVLDDDRGSPMPPLEKPMTTLYLTGHSLGGAMAALMAVMLSVEPDYIERFAPIFQGRLHLRRTDGGLAGVRQRLRREHLPGPERGPLRLQKDLVPHLPPSESDDFQHFGREYRYDRAWQDTSDKPITQMGDLLGLIEAPLGFVASKFRLLRGIPFRFSLNDHGPAALHLRHHPAQGTQRVWRRLPDPGDVTSRRTRLPPQSMRPCGARIMHPTGERFKHRRSNRVSSRVS